MTDMKPLEAPITRPLRDDGAPEWQQIIALFERFNLPPPPVRLRDELAIMLAWARYGEALHAASSQGEWKMVPVEPTREMTRAANERVALVTPDGTWAIALDEARRTYSAMLDAAPAQQVQP